MLTGCCIQEIRGKWQRNGREDGRASWPGRPPFLLRTDIIGSPGDSWSVRATAWRVLSGRCRPRSSKPVGRVERRCSVGSTPITRRHPPTRSGYQYPLWSRRDFRSEPACRTHTLNGGLPAYTSARTTARFASNSSGVINSSSSSSLSFRRRSFGLGSPAWGAAVDAWGAAVGAWVT
jgi:hypothetical protein